MIRIFLFAVYYLRKILSVFLGFHRTRNPLSLRWRWNYWNDNAEEIYRQGKAKISSKRAAKKALSANNS